MRLRTSVFLLVQVTGLIFPAAGAFAASAQGYGSGEYSAPQSQSRTAQTTTRGTVLEMPAASDAAGQASSPPSARPGKLRRLCYVCIIYCFANLLLYTFMFPLA